MIPNKSMLILNVFPRYETKVGPVVSKAFSFNGG